MSSLRLSLGPAANGDPHVVADGDAAADPAGLDRTIGAERDSGRAADATKLRRRQKELERPRRPRRQARHDDAGDARLAEAHVQEPGRTREQRRRQPGEIRFVTDEDDTTRTTDPGERRQDGIRSGTGYERRHDLDILGRCAEAVGDDLGGLDGATERTREHALHRQLERAQAGNHLAQLALALTRQATILVAARSARFFGDGVTEQQQKMGTSHDLRLSQIARDGATRIRIPAAKMRRFSIGSRP